LKWLALVLAVVLALIAVAAIVVYLVLGLNTSLTLVWQDPVTAIEPDKIRPDMALYPMAGSSAVELIDAAIASGDLDTAYAALVLDPDLTDPQRVGRLVRLGAGFAQAGRSDLANVSYQQVYDLAIVSPFLHDPARAEALLAAANGWTDMGREPDALRALDQVYVIALRSPYLQMKYRRDLLTTLERAFNQLDDASRAQTTRQRIIELDQGANPQPPAKAAESPSLPTGQEPVSTPLIGELEEARRQAAYELQQRVAPGQELSSNAVLALSEALQTEDQAKEDFYRAELANEMQLGRRVELHWQLIRWLTTKYRIALRGYGVSLVPAWEERVGEIQSSLSKAYEDLYFDYEDLVATLPEASLVWPGSYDVRRRIIQSGRLGLYPNYPELQLTEKLSERASELIAGGEVLPLYVDWSVDDAGLWYRLSPADEYGQQRQQGLETGP
jgi:hypothetical protein